MATRQQDHPPALDVLLATIRPALFLDFDGTLVRIADTPGGIVVPGDLIAGLEVLAGSVDGRLAIVSGRSLADLRLHVGQPRIAFAGSHGVELVGADGVSIGDGAAALPDDVLAEVAAFARSRPGIDHEAKTHGAALHFRAHPSLGDAATSFIELLARQHGLRAKRGKMVVELVHDEANKGRAVQAFMAAPPFLGSLPIFVGDDVTDEDGFLAAAELGGFGILVGAERPSAARYRLNTPEEVREWLGLRERPNRGSPNLPRFNEQG